MHQLRKTWKKNALQTLRRHYFTLIVVCLVASYVGTEFSSSTNALDLVDIPKDREISAADGRMGRESFWDLYTNLVNDGIVHGPVRADNVKEAFEALEPEGSPLGWAKGAGAAYVNSFSSGHILIAMAQGIRAIAYEGTLRGGIPIFGSMMVYLFLWIMGMNVVQVILRRIFLESRRYEKVPLQHALYLKEVRRWANGALTMFVAFVVQWGFVLTVIGGPIMRYAYFMVPYIVAENPDVHPMTALRLSRKMMRGHKWELFLLDMSFMPWYLLSALTGGISDLGFGVAYRVATFTEYYVVRRQEAKERGLADAVELNDPWLIEKAPPEVLEEAYPATEEGPVPEMTLLPIQRFFMRTIGLWVGRTKTHDQYQALQEARYQQDINREVRAGKLYPVRLAPLWNRQKKDLECDLLATRSYTIWVVMALFFLFAILGWCWEVALHMMTNGTFVNRGTLHGPWLPIYGGGGAMILMLLTRLRRYPAWTFGVIFVLCGVLEYGASVYLEATYGQRWWDYTGYFLNLDGRTCAEGLIIFAIAGVVIIYWVAPLLNDAIAVIPKKILVPVLLLLLLLFGMDAVYSQYHPNVGEGVTDYSAYKKTAMEYHGRAEMDLLDGPASKASLDEFFQADQGEFL